MLILRVSFQAQQTFPVDVEREAMCSAQKDKLLRAFESVRNYEDMPSKADVAAKEATGWRRAKRGNTESGESGTPDTRQRGSH